MTDPTTTLAEDIRAASPDDAAEAVAALTNIELFALCTAIASYLTLTDPEAANTITMLAQAILESLVSTDDSN